MASFPIHKHCQLSLTNLPTITTSSIKKITEGFPFPQIPPIAGQLCYDTISKLQLKIDANSAFVQPNLGYGQFGHLVLAIKKNRCMTPSMLSHLYIRLLLEPHQFSQHNLHPLKSWASATNLLKILSPTNNFPCWIKHSNKYLLYPSRKFLSNLFLTNTSDTPPGNCGKFLLWDQRG